MNSLKKNIITVNTNLNTTQAYFSDDPNIIYASANIHNNILKTYEEYDSMDRSWKPKQILNINEIPAVMKKNICMDKIIRQTNHSNLIKNLHVLPEMKALTYTTDGIIYISDNNEMNIIAQIPQVNPNHLAVSHDNLQIGISTMENDIIIYDIRKLSTPISKKITATQSCITSMNFNRNDIITGYDNGEIIMWESKQICKHFDIVVDIHCPSNTSYFLTTSYDKQIKLWNLDGSPYNLKKSLTLQRTEMNSTIPTKYNEHYDESKNSINGYAGYLFGRTCLSPNARYLAMSNAHVLNIINPYKEKVEYRYKLAKEVSITGICFAPDENNILITDNSGIVNIFPLDLIKVK